jgi:hypothetical protein
MKNIHKEIIDEINVTNKEKLGNLIHIVHFHSDRR